MTSLFMIGSISEMCHAFIAACIVLSHDHGRLTRHLKDWVHSDQELKRTIKTEHNGHPVGCSFPFLCSFYFLPPPHRKCSSYMFDFGQQAVKHHRACHCTGALFALSPKPHYLADGTSFSYFLPKPYQVTEATFAITFSPEWRRRGWRPRRTAASLH